MSEDFVSHASESRIIVIDDNESIHRDFKMILGRSDSEANSDLDDLESELFGANETKADAVHFTGFEIETASQGKKATRRSRPPRRRASPLPWPSSTCACRRVGMA